MLLKIVKRVRGIKRMLVIKIRKFAFCKQALVEEEKTLEPLITLRCSNQNGTRESIHIGNHCMIGAFFCVEENGTITVGDHSFIGENTTIGSAEKISIGRCAIISNHVHIYDNNNHPTSAIQREQMSMSEDFNGELWSWKYAQSKPIIIEDNVWIGEYASVLKGVRIGKGSIVASHSVVTKDVPPGVIVAGNPARVVKKCEE